SIDLLDRLDGLVSGRQLRFVERAQEPEPVVELLGIPGELLESILDIPEEQERELSEPLHALPKLFQRRQSGSGFVFDSAVHQILKESVGDAIIPQPQKDLIELAVTETSGSLVKEGHGPFWDG
ncbi:MAG TPA: hypothetical protein VIJ26_19165, partial [Thermoanaerobaculia bacterium]